MKKRVSYIFSLLTLAIGLGACEKDYGSDSLGPLQDSIADIPVTVTNREFFERVPIVTASVKTVVPAPGTGNGPFSITFEIPADKGKIREISRINTGTQGLNLLQNGTAQQALNYNGNAAAPGYRVIPGNGTNQITFTSSLAEYGAYRTRVAALTGGAAVNAGQTPVVAPNTTFNAQNPNQLRFFFMLTLEDGREIIPMEVRIRVVD
ncbi:hypothetical protein [Hymenobacter algoricola]|uniref:DUF1735 domain-containing protein n=1 Tax=Hymenobacter algoricola TaxID=486267 RepID=A0ABP7MR61_9BACT